MKDTNTPAFIHSILFGIAQFLLWGSSFFLLAILGEPIINDTGWSHELVYGSLSVALMISGLLAPIVGKRISKRQSNNILMYSGIVMAIGLLLIATAKHKFLFVLGWSITGIAMAMGMFDALFASLGKRYGHGASKAITYITVISGFCTTLTWPVLTLLLEYFSWRIICLLYALVLLVFIFPIYRWTLHSPNRKEEKAIGDPAMIKTSSIPVQSKIYYLMLISFTIGSVLMTGISVHLINILVNNDISLPAAVSLGALLGPSQVGVRLLDMLLPKKTPLIAAVLSAMGVLLGLSLLLCGPEIAFVAVIFYGFGNGMRTILRSTLPLHVFGSHDYASIMGNLARPQLIAQAFTPIAGGFLIRHFGMEAFLLVLCGLAVVNVLLTYGIRYFLAIEDEISKKLIPSIGTL